MHYSPDEWMPRKMLKSYHPPTDRNPLPREACAEKQHLQRLATNS